ncbi:hypothetical protein HY440_01910 [Candidatus Microgenomates bacterium]|nr:hypothetical protein [Candidatus Microgenomates bacterium]
MVAFYQEFAKICSMSARFEHGDGYNAMAENVAKNKTRNGLREKLQDALVILLGHREISPAMSPRREEKRGDSRQGLSELFNGWH